MKASPKYDIIIIVSLGLAPFLKGASCNGKRS